MDVHLQFRDPDWPARAIDTVKALVAECRSELDECERIGRFPAETYQRMGARGLLGVITPKEWGGLGGDAPEYCFTTEAMCRWGLVSSQVQIQGMRWMNDWGTPEQKRKYLPGMVAGSLVFSESISEPGAGSSLKKLATTAVRKGGDWVINGKKIHINLGAESHVTLVYAMTDEGLTSFLVDTDSKGLTRRHSEPLGYRFLPTADMIFDDVRVPDAALLGAPGEGMKTFLSTFNVSRLGNASELIGFATRALAEATDYARQRSVGPNKVADFQGIQWTLADCYSALYAASLARDHAANRVKNGQEFAMATSLAKKLAVDAAEKTTNDVFALTGGYGLYRDKPFGQLLYEVKTLRIAGGSVEILRNYIAGQILKDEQLKGLK
ncbi:MAG: acyl-CoA/acyl-ACP dehydrogenase [Proteobacteria bacterium]|nr:acyl-CoA/acyl-ACP dehydrogenase [Pseudomonadota bacterium]